MEDNKENKTKRVTNENSGSSVIGPLVFVVAAVVIMYVLAKFIG